MIEKLKTLLKINKKCIFYSQCELKSEDSVSCNNNKVASNYYQTGSPCGCYRKNLKNLKNNVIFTK